MNEVAVTALAASIPKSGSLQVGNELANLARHVSITAVSSAENLALGIMGFKARFGNHNDRLHVSLCRKPESKMRDVALICRSAVKKIPKPAFPQVGLE